MDEHDSRDHLPRRTFLRRCGALVAIGFGAGISAVRAQSAGTPQASPTWSPPDLPKPLPTQGGTPPTPVGAAGTPAATPVASPGSSANPVEEPGTAAQPVGGTPEGATPEPNATVTITPEFTFDPDNLTIQVGDVVRWHNAGRSPQTVTADPARVQDPSHVSVPDGAEPFDSGAINAGEDFTHRFDVAGDYTYVSIPMESDGMVGHITVEGKG